MIIDEAMRLYRMGWCVVPMKPSSKKPDLPWKRYQKQRPAESTVRSWFKSDPERGLAVVLGPVSGGLVCRDFDQMDAYEAWAAKFPEWAERLPQSETSRGRHVFCLTESPVEAISRNGSSIIDFGDGELRGGGLAVLPPSVHQSGHVYRWVIPPDVIPLVDLEDIGLSRRWCELNADSSQSVAGQRPDFTDEDREYRGGLKTTDATEDNRCHGSRGALATQIDFLPIRDDIEQAIVATIPTGQGRRNKAVFELARHLKAIPALHDANPIELCEIVLKWHQRSSSFIQTQSPEETQADFIRGWSNVKFPAGSSTLRTLFVQALAKPMPDCCERFPTVGMKRLISLCRELGAFWDPAPFPLACRCAGELLEVTHTTANSWLFLLTNNGILELHSKGSQSTHKASRFFYRGD